MADPLPFDEVYRLYGARIYRFCVLRVSDRDAAEDIAAEVFMNAYAAYARVKPDPETVLLWLFRIARNQSISYLRRQRSLGRIVGRLRNEREAPTDVEAQAVLNDDLKQALAAISSLSQRDRTAVSLRIGAGLSFAEIGKVLGMNEAAAAAATYRAIKKAQALLDRES